MTGPGTQDEALTAAARDVPAPDATGRGRVRMPGLDLVIFRAPVAGFSQRLP
jgi:hypothetical protein